MGEGEELSIIPPTPEGSFSLLGRLLVIGPSVGKTPWRRTQQATLVFLTAEFQGQRSLAGYSPWGCKESDTIERLTLSL